MTNDPNRPIGEPLDFGDDENSIDAPADPQFDAWLDSAAPSINAPNEAPRLEMWAAIRAAQQTPSRRTGTRVLEFKNRRWFWPAAIAAALLSGIVVDRFALNRAPATQAATNVAIKTDSTPTTKSAADPAGLYRLAAEQTLTQAEALLTAYRASDVRSTNPASAKQLGNWGRDILSSTRLLLDSPAGSDQRLHALLSDLELVLVQIIDLSGAPLDSSDRALIDGALRDRDLLPRIRTAVPAGTTASSATDD